MTGIYIMLIICFSFMAVFASIDTANPKTNDALKTEREDFIKIAFFNHRPEFRYYQISSPKSTIKYWVQWNQNDGFWHLSEIDDSSTVLNDRHISMFYASSLGIQTAVSKLLEKLGTQ